MTILIFTDELAAERAQQRIDYDRLFGYRRTPEWLRRYEQQILDECRRDLSFFDDPTWKRVFEERVKIANADNKQ